MLFFWEIVFARKHKPPIQACCFSNLKAKLFASSMYHQHTNCTNYISSKKNILSKILIMNDKVSQRTKAGTTVTISRGLPCGLTMEHNSMTKQIFHCSCPVGFDAMNFPCCLLKESFKCICAILISPFYVGGQWGKRHLVLCFHILT